MAGDDSFGCSGLFQCFCGLVEAFLRPRSGGFPANNPRYLRSSSSEVRRTGSPWDVGISSGPPVTRDLRFGYQEEDWSPVARISQPQPHPQQSDDDDDDCVIVGEKGEVACRDFPHSRHLCSNMPFGTTSHEKHCTMCYCYVCDAPAPCSYWGKALSVDDHCHATDKETKWRTLREAFKQRSSGSGTSNGHSAQVSHSLALTAGASRAHPVAGAGRGTGNARTAQISHPLAIAVHAQRASSATRVQSGTSNGHSAQVTRLVVVGSTVSAPRPNPAAGAGRNSSNAHTALVTHPVQPTVSAARPYSAARTGTGTRNAHTSQITHPVEPTVSGTRAYPGRSTGRGISNAQIIRPVEQATSASRVYPAARAGTDSSNAHSAQITYPTTASGDPDAPEGATVYVGNLPYRIDSESLKLSFQPAGVILFSKVIYDRETGQSRGFGFVTMRTVQEAETAVRMNHDSDVYGRRLIVNIAAPRGAARVDTARRQSGSPLKIFVCNLPPQVDNSRLEELFSKHGKVVDARVIYGDREGDCCSRGFGFVTMATEEESYNAIHALNKQVLEGHALGVHVSRERPERGSPSPSNQAPLQNAVGRNQNAHTSVRASPNVAPTVSAPTRDRSGTSNAYTAQATHRLDPPSSN